MEFKKLLNVELFKNIDSFMNEISLTMDYISDETTNNINKYIKQLKNQDELLDEFVKYTYEHLNQYQLNFSGALFSDKKVKSNFYDFLNDIILFNNYLYFSIFKDESKATKKQFVSYLYNIYLSCSCLVKFDNEKNSDLLSKELTEFIQKIKESANDAVSKEYEKTPKPKLVKRRNAISGMPGLPGDFNGKLNDIMSSILGNTHILDIASDISNQMHTQNLNPMTMLTSLMSEDITDSPLNGLVTQIQAKVEMKINSGEINKELLETQAQNIMNNLDDKININNINSMEGISEILKNMSNC